MEYWCEEIVVENLTFTRNNQLWKTNPMDFVFPGVHQNSIVEQVSATEIRVDSQRHGGSFSAYLVKE